MRATVAAFGLTVAVLLTMVAPTAMVAAAFTVALVYVAVTHVRPRVAGTGIPVPGTNARILIRSTRSCDCEDPKYAIAVSLVERSG